MERLNQILTSYVADEGNNEVHERIPGAAFVVVDKNGSRALSRSQPTIVAYFDIRPYLPRLRWSATIHSSGLS
jgi:hypothetical protein